jgi:triosephosphate isomerase (TIM)
MANRVVSPFFEFGPKTFLNRSALLTIAEAASAASLRYDVAVIITPPALDIEALKSRFPALWIFAQGMDDVPKGLTTGAVLPEALRAVGADGVLLNHAERPLDIAALRSSISRANEADLQTLVCADDTSEAVRYAAWSPDIVLLEPHHLIGTADADGRPWIEIANREVAEVDQSVLVMHGGGVADPDTVRSLVAQGADGTGCTSAVVHSHDPVNTITSMIRAAREGWDQRPRAIVSSTSTDKG